METLPDLVEKLVSKNNDDARKSFITIEKSIKKNQFSTEELSSIVPVLATSIMDMNMKFWSVLLLSILAQRKIDIRTAVPHLENLLNVSYEKGGRDFVVKALDFYYAYMKNEKQLKPIKELEKVNAWNLQKYSRRPFYSCLNEDISTFKKGFLDCPLCGSKDTLKTFYTEESVGTNISGADILTYEILCKNCFVFSVFNSVDSFGPTG